MTAVRHAARAAGVASALTVLASLGLPAVAAAAGLAALLLAAVCWVIASRDRSDHLMRIFLGLRGDARCLHSVPSPEPPAAPGALKAPLAVTSPETPATGCRQVQ